MLSPTQMAQVRLYLGYPDHFRYKHTRLESVLANLSPEAETQVADLLTKIASIDTAFLDAGTNGAGIKRVDEIWFENGWVRVSMVKKTGRSYVARLSTVLGVPINTDFFGSSGYSGDGFSGLGGGDRGNGKFYGLG